MSKLLSSKKGLVVRNSVKIMVADEKQHRMNLSGSYRKGSLHGTSAKLCPSILEPSLYVNKSFPRFQFPHLFFSVEMH